MLEKFYKNIRQGWGQEGEKWLKNLNKLVESLCSEWDINHIKPLSNLSFNYVASGIQKNKEIILKICIEAHTCKNEGLALKAYQGNGAVLLLDQNFEKNALILEKIEPGYNLISWFPKKEKEAIQETASLIAKLHHASHYSKSDFPFLKDWFNSLKKDLPIPLYHRQKALFLVDKLISSSQEHVLLHGDLHHENILFSKNKGWIAIDPKGIIGDPAFEPGAFIRNPLGKIHEITNTQEVIVQRIKLFSNYLNLDPVRIQQWAYIQAVLAACWDIESHNDDYFLSLKTAEIIDNI